MSGAWGLRRLLALLAGLVLVASACGDNGGRSVSNRNSEDGDGAVTASDLVHIHRLQPIPGEEGLYVATHTGLFKLAAGDIQQVSAAAHDLMGFTVAGPNDLLASGHPDLRVDALMVDGKPPLLGLAQSSDGRDWQPLSLLGEVDFHSLVTAHDRVYGVDSQTGALMVSDDRKTWDTRSKGLAFSDIAVSPHDPDVLIAAAQDGLMKSDDGGRSWMKAAPQRLAYLSWTEVALFGVSPAGTVVRSDDGGGRWQPLNELKGQPAALLVVDDAIYVAVHEAGIMQSTDGGRNFDFLIRTDQG